MYWQMSVAVWERWLALWGRWKVCVYVWREGVCGRDQGKIITANWPEALFPLLLPHPGHTQETCGGVLLTPVCVGVCARVCVL